jgi:hypothetical protein
VLIDSPRPQVESSLPGAIPWTFEVINLQLCCQFGDREKTDRRQNKASCLLRH